MLTSSRWHNDLNLKNILVFSGDPEASYERLKFKISDLGLCQIETLVVGDGETTARKEATMRNRPGTRTYGMLSSAT